MLAGPNTAFAMRSAIQTRKGHGRTETRTIHTAKAKDIDFPHATQVFRVAP